VAGAVPRAELKTGYGPPEIGPSPIATAGNAALTAAAIAKLLSGAP
jgi:hypothetical protein